MSRPIIIAGFMGAGKTTVAAALAQRLVCAMIDLDSLIKERSGLTPQELIDEAGEKRFREIESEALSAALETEQAYIIALGGGAWTLAHNRALINEHKGFTVWLDAPFELCWRRITSENAARPFARDEQSARMLYQKRREFYDQAVLHVKITEDKTPEMIAAEIVRELPRTSVEGERRTRQGNTDEQANGRRESAESSETVKER